MSEQCLNDEALIEMADQLKKTYDEITFKLEKLQLENLELKKNLISAYGFTRVLDMIASDSYELQPEILILIETLRAYLSTTMDNTIFNPQN